MNSEQILEKFKDEYEECTESDNFEICMTCEGVETPIFLKPKPKFPIVFKDVNYDIEVYAQGVIRVVEKWLDGIKQNLIVFDSGNLPLLEQAVAKSRELRGLK